MGDLLIRNIPDDLRIALKAQASGHNRSLSDEVCAVLQSALLFEQESILKPKMSVVDVFREFGDAMHADEESEMEWKKILDDARKAPDREVADFE